MTSSPPRYSVYSKLLLTASVVNTATLLFDDIPSETQFKEYLVKKFLKPRYLQFLENANYKFILPASLLSALFSLYKLFTQPHTAILSTFSNTFAQNSDVTISETPTSASTTFNQTNALDISLTGVDSAKQMYYAMLTRHPSVTNAPRVNNTHIISDKTHSILNKPSTVQLDPTTGYHYITRSLLDSNGQIPLNFQSAPSSSQSLFTTLRSILTSCFTTSIHFGKRVFESIFQIKSYRRLLLISIISAILSWTAAKFAWRIRSNYKAYADLDLRACERDAIEYSHPSRPLLGLLFVYLEYFFNPVFVGVEKLLPYCQLLETITPQSSQRLNGITLFKEGFVPFHEVIQMNEDLSMTISTTTSTSNQSERYHNNNPDTQLYSPITQSISPFIGNVESQPCETPYNYQPNDVTHVAPFSLLNHTSLVSPRFLSTHPPLSASLPPSAPNPNNSTIFTHTSSQSHFHHHDNNTKSKQLNTDAQTLPALPTPTTTAQNLSALLSPAQSTSHSTQITISSSLSSSTPSSSSSQHSSPLPSPSPLVQHSSTSHNIPPLGALPFKLPLQSPCYNPKPSYHAQLWDYDRKPRPLLFVANHTPLAFDMVAFQWALCGFLNVYPRGLAHRGHFNFPIWAQALRYLGAIAGTRELTGKLMEAGCPTLVYPGGSREVMRKYGEPKYDLIWGQRCGFAKVAMQFNAIIIPVAFVGCGENFKHIGDLSFQWLYGNYAIQDQTIPLDGEEKFITELKLIKVRTKQLHQFGVIQDLMKLSEWENDAIIQLCKKYQDLYTTNHLPIPDILQAYLDRIQQSNTELSSDLLFDSSGSSVFLTKAKLDGIDEDEDEDSVLIRTKPTAKSKSATGPSKKKHDNKKTNNRSRSSNNNSRAEDEEQKDDKGSISLSTSSSSSSSNASNTTRLLPAASIAPTGSNPSTHHATFFSTASTVLSASVHELPVTIPPKPIPKIPQQGLSSDRRVTLPICFPHPNPAEWQRLYYIIGDPIDCAEYQGLEEDDLAQRHLRDRVKLGLEQAIHDGQKHQSVDPDRYTLHRWKKSIQGLFGF